MPLDAPQLRQRLVTGWLRLVDRARKAQYSFMVVMAVLIGVGGGFAAILFRYLIEGTTYAFSGGATQTPDGFARTVERAEAAQRLAAAETARRASARLAAAGTLTAGMAHEVRSPMNAIGLAAQRLERRLGEDEEGRASARRVGLRPERHVSCRERSRWRDSPWLPAGGGAGGC